MFIVDGYAPELNHQMVQHRCPPRSYQTINQALVYWKSNRVGVIKYKGEGFIFGSCQCVTGKYIHRIFLKDEKTMIDNTHI